MNILAIDTAGPVIGVALLAGAVVRQRTERVQRGADARLMPWAVALCEQAEISLSDLHGVAVAHGPGGFTGIRVGLATAKGLCAALEVPLVGLSSLHSRGYRPTGQLPILSMLDARKSRVYGALYSPRGELLAGPADVDPAVALAWVDGPFIATGEGALVYADAVAAAGGALAPEAEHPAVDALARLAAGLLGAGQGQAPDLVAPVYLREPDAKPPKRSKP